MLATMINSMVQAALESVGFIKASVSYWNETNCRAIYKRKAVRHLEKGRIVIFGAGTGNPYFTTDSAASLRAVEIDADVILKGTRVDGVYDQDPELNPSAKYDFNFWSSLWKQFK